MMSQNTQYDSSLIGQRDLRLEKIAKLKQKGFEVYPAKAERTHTSKEIQDNFNEVENQEVKVIGRIRSRREHGKLAFMDLEDTTGKVQIYIKEDILEPASTFDQNLGWENLELVDDGDFIQVSGTATKTLRGEISILAKQVRLVAKAIRPLPTEFEDKELRFRRRYLDMVIHPEIRERMQRRSMFWQATREFMNQNGFTEINIPVLEHVTGGADANPFVTHYDALDQDFYLRISHELPLKRLIGAGFEKVYDIGVRFRNEGIDDEHLPEHIAMEWYWAYADYRQGMEFTKELFKYVLQTVFGTLKFTVKGMEVDLTKEWQEIQFVDVIKERFGVDVFNTPVAEMAKILKDNGVDLGTEEVNRNRAVDNLWKIIRKGIAGPAFLVGVPKFMSPLAKTNEQNPLLCDRFHPILAGSEQANAFGELNDPVDQFERFYEQQSMRDAGDDEAQMLDIDYVEMLEYGMPPAVGFGWSERVFWAFEGVSAKEGVPFPQLRSDIDNVTKEIYPQMFAPKQKNMATTTEVATDIDDKHYDIARAESFINKYISSEYLLLHSEMVSTAMQAVAKHLGENAEKFAFTGLIHDWDFDKWPTEHPGHYDLLQTELPEVDVEIIDAIKAHADLDYPRHTNLSKALLALDELSGLMFAIQKMVGSYTDMKVSSINKKLTKELGFAAKINREDILTGIRDLGIPQDELLEVVKTAFAAKYDK